MSGVAELYTEESTDVQADFEIGVGRGAPHPRDVRMHEYIPDDPKLTIELQAIVSIDWRLMTFVAYDIQTLDALSPDQRLSHTAGCGIGKGCMESPGFRR